MDDIIIIVTVLIARIDKVDSITRMKVVLPPLVSTPYSHRIVDVGSTLIQKTLVPPSDAPSKGNFRCEKECAISGNSIDQLFSSCAS